MFWGMSAFNISRGNTRIFNFQSNYYDLTGSPTIDTNYSTTTGIYGVLLSYFFLARRGCNSSNNEWFQILDHTTSCVNNNNCDPSTV